MFVIEFVGEWNEPLIPAIAACLAASDQQHCNPSRVECVENPIGVAPILNPQFTQVRMLRAADARGVRIGQMWPLPFQQANNGCNFVLLAFSEFLLPPGSSVYSTSQGIKYSLCGI